MRLLDFFKERQRRKKAETLPKKTSPEKPADEKSDLKKTSEVSLGESRRAAVLLRSPRITEKSSVLSENGVYVFQVSERASKPEIKKAVEELYKVGVESVRLVTVPSRARRVGRTIGRKAGFKKAMVKLREGQKIEYI